MQSTSLSLIMQELQLVKFSFQIRVCATLLLGEHADDQHSRLDTHGHLTGMTPGMDWRERRVSFSEALTCALESIM